MTQQRQLGVGEPSQPFISLKPRQGRPPVLAVKLVSPWQGTDVAALARYLPGGPGAGREAPSRSQDLGIPRQSSGEDFALSLPRARFPVREEPTSCKVGKKKKESGLRMTAGSWGLFR